METARARNIAVAEYWDDHPYLTRHEAKMAVERALGFTRDTPNSAEVDSLRQDVQSLTKQVASLRQAIQQMAETQRLEKQPPPNHPVKTVKL